MVLVDVEEEAAALGERRHVAGALRCEAHGGAVQRLELRADRLVEVEEYQHGRLGCRGPRLRRRRGRGPRHHRGERPLAAGHGRRRRHPAAAAGTVAVSSSVGADGDSATAQPRSPRPPRVFATWRCLPPGFLGWLRPSACGRGRGRSGFGLASRWLLFPSGVSFARCALKSF